jgi:type VI secretion system secreted protein Hcp
MAVDMHLLLDGIKGEAKKEEKTDNIDVLAWSWGLSNSGTMHGGGGGGSGKANIQDISLTKYIDKSSPTLMLKCAQGEHLKKATLSVAKAGGKSSVEYLVITMDKVLISSVSTGGSGGEDRLTENITLNFEKVEVNFQPQKDDGSKDGGTIDMVWDIPKQTDK